MAKSSIRALIVEDSEEDAELILKLFKKEGHVVHHEIVSSPQKMQEALSREQWDVILSDYSMPGFTGIKALEIMKATGLDIPFILVSGKIDEETAVEAMKKGAVDYISKNNLSRLVPAVEREIKDYIIKANERITQSKLNESEEKYRLIVDNTSDLVFLIDLEGNFIFMNKGIEKHTGYTESEIIGKNIKEFLSPRSYSEAISRIQLRLEGAKELPKYEVEIISKNNELINFELNTSPIYDDDNIVSILIVARDISSRKKNEEKIKSLNETIRILNKILRHDILNDLTLLLNIVDTCKEGDEKMKKSVFSTINKSVNLIERMRELEQAVTFGDSLKRCKMIDFVDLVIRNHPEIEFKLKGNCTILADDAIISVIDNIVQNAIKHGKTKRIDIALTEGNDYCEIKIADYGTGIPDHIKDKIFEEGFSYGEGRSSGLGLYIVKKVIERYGGEIMVEDNSPSGAVFIISLKRGG